MRHQPQNISRNRDQIRTAHVYKNFAAGKGVSHIGLGVAALNTSKTLREHGIEAEVWPCQTVQDVDQHLRGAQDDAAHRGAHPISHVIISAPWIKTSDMQGLLMRYPRVEFACTSHSNIGFLAADTNGIKLLREYVGLVDGYHNFTLAGNCRKFVAAWQTMYSARVQYLPNLYDVETIRHVGHRVPWHPGQTLKIGIFGATRPLKNMVSATSAAVELGAALRADVEIWMSSGRDEGGGTVKNAVEQIVSGLTHVKLVQTGWRPWPDFRRIVGQMHLLMSPSYTESFCMCAADGVAEGVASVISEAIDWAPRDWIANVDNTNDMARVGRRLLHDVHAVDEGQKALRNYVRDGILVWEDWLIRGLR